MPINTQSHGNTQAHSEFEQRYTGSVTNQQDNHISAEQVRRSLKGARFPATKDQLADYAKERGIATAATRSTK